MNIVPASQNSFAAAVALLRKNDLPTEDINPGTQLFVIEEGAEITGTIAVEYDYTDALLRSLCVAVEKRGQGLGAQLVDFIENYVRNQGVGNIYLLTTTAAEFFAGRGYAVIDRTEAAPFIRQTSEYCSVCPASATLM